MKIFDIRKAEFLSAILFSALFALIEGASALALSVGGAMFLAGVGVEGMPLSYILLFVVMLGVMGAVASLQAKFSLSRVLHGLLIAAAILVGTMALAFSFSPSGFFSTVMLYVLVLSAPVWTYASFSLYWNLADEYFSIRDGKRLYAIFSAAGCMGAVLGAGAVFVFSEYIKINTSVLLWLWLALILLSIPILTAISSRCSRLETGISFDSADTGVLKTLSASFSEMRKSVYIRSMLFMYVAVVIAASINEYVSMSAFSDYAEGVAKLAGITDAAKLQEAAQINLASIFGALGVGVNVFNFAVNLFFFNKLVSRFGVANIALLQSLLYMVAFIWLINSFGIAAAIFSFFMYRGVMESVDANNENLMVSVLPGALRQQVRLMIESFIVPFATAVAGVFLMLYARAEEPLEIKSAFFADISRFFAFGSLSITGIAIVGFLAALAGLAFAFLTRREYPKVLERNLRAGWLDFSESMEDIAKNSATNSAKKSDENFAGIFGNGNPAQIISAAQAARYSNPKLAVRAILENAEKFAGMEESQAAEILASIFDRNDFGVTSYAIEWLLDDSRVHPDFAVLAVARSGSLAHSLASGIDGARSMKIKAMLRTGESAAEIPQSCDILKEQTVTRKIKILSDIESLSNPAYERIALEMVSDENPEVCAAALGALAKCCTSFSSVFSKKIAAMFKHSSAKSQAAILEILSKTDAHESMEILFDGVTGISVQVRRHAMNLLISMGVVAVPSLVAILKSDSFSYEVKAICAQALRKLFLPQLKLLADEILPEEISKAYEFAECEYTLSQCGGEAESLRRIFAWKRKSAVSFIVLMLSLSGRLPAHEPLLSALFARSGKESANAIEAIEQGVRRREFELLLPLIDGRDLKSLADFAGKKLGKETISKEAILDSALASHFDEDFLSAAAILLAENSERVETCLCEKIGALSGGFLRGELLELIDFIALEKFSADKSVFARRHSCLHYFSALNLCGYFDNFEPSAICELLQCVEPLEDSNAVFEADCIVVTSEGNGFFEARAKEVAKGERANIDIGGLAFFIKRSDVLKVAAQFPDAAMSIYLREECAR